MTWEIFLGIGALVTFVIAIVTPLIKLNTSITKLNTSVNVLQAAIDRIEVDNKESHKRLWDHNKEQDDIIAKHDKAIINFKHIVYSAEKMSPNVQGLHDLLEVDANS